jgi:hypothetical protein
MNNPNLKLVEEYHPLPIMEPVRRMGFCAHDTDEHAIQFVGNCWEMHNKFSRVHGKPVKTCPNLIAALSELERRASKSVEFFTLTDLYSNR